MAAGPVVDIAIERKHFASQSRPLLEDFQLRVEPSSVLALVGPSGVGKSTLLRMIGGIDTAFSGDVRIDEAPAAAAPPAGFVFQDARLLPWLTALENIRAVRPATTRDEAAAILARVGLAGSGNAYPHELSGGMQRRVALARAVSVNPRLLLLDEPFVSLDRTLVGEIQQVFLDLLRTSRPTVIIVTHLPEDAARLADRAVVLGGRPAGIVADMRFDTPLADRSPAEIERLARSLGGVAQDTVS